MPVIYNKLFKLLIDRRMSSSELMNKAGFSANIITRLKKNEYVSMESIEKICNALQVGVDEILDFVSVESGGPNERL
ncbi:MULTISPECIES: helix-turn-helix domain-containing protein [Eubacteriales]|uniref:DNA-binding transcriptional regulator, XRE family n=1 Tax=Papillibacter cinnamivorans DSM 12816 TaxID=1122930 RepID=A0A1W2ALB7_9FIRM|nr:MULTISPECIES: helix-turn-helix transcriptional regulator [Eubacteriales]SMC61529.1 DNA-binding transcriptional regulator, XRE family [Papillibacter cinnamivorans DSM 12816]